MKERYFAEAIKFQPASIEGPLLDIYETRESLVFEMDLPGINTNDVRVNVDGDTLSIEGTKRGLYKQGLRYICMERNFRKFKRATSFPVPVEVSSGRAAYKNGVLTITFKKLGAKNAIEIKIEKE